MECQPQNVVHYPHERRDAVDAPPLTRKGQATRDRIVAAAARLTYDRGVAGTSIEDVQLIAHASGSQMYHYFRDKADLVRAVIEKQTALVLDGQEPLFTRLDSLEGLRAWRDFIVEYRRALNCTGACPLGLLASELAESDATAREHLAAAFSQWAASIAHGLRSMQDRGELRAEADPDRLAFALLAAAQGGMLLTQTMRDLYPLESALDTTIAHIASLVTTREGSDRPAA
jgi:TetR/AcrR family transcriptional regulator, transcriptional repressor for nem operon